MRYNAGDSMLFGFEFFDRDNNRLLKTGYNFESKASQEYILEPGERIIGFRASGYSATHAAFYNFQFVIGAP
jgi:hypothetical protein